MAGRRRAGGKAAGAHQATGAGRAGGRGAGRRLDTSASPLLNPALYHTARCLPLYTYPHAAWRTTSHASAHSCLPHWAGRRRAGGRDSSFLVPSLPLSPPPPLAATLCTLCLMGGAGQGIAPSLILTRSPPHSATPGVLRGTGWVVTSHMPAPLTLLPAPHSFTACLHACTHMPVGLTPMGGCHSCALSSSFTCLPPIPHSGQLPPPGRRGRGDATATYYLCAGSGWRRQGGLSCLGAASCLTHCALSLAHTRARICLAPLLRRASSRRISRVHAAAHRTTACAS